MWLNGIYDESLVITADYIDAKIYWHVWLESLIFLHEIVQSK